MNGYRSDIRIRKMDKPVPAHFRQPDHTLEELEVKGIENIHKDCTKWGKREIFTLRTLAPGRMNLDE